MSAKAAVAREVYTPVAIRDIELPRNQSFTVETFELCTLCGARYGIGYSNGGCKHQDDLTESDELPKKLTELLAKDHRQNREHKSFIELDL